MAGKQVQRRRGTTAQHGTFIGAAGEVTVDTTKFVQVVHDGITPGGYPQASARDLATTNANVTTAQNAANAAQTTANTANTKATTAQNEVDALEGVVAGKANLNTSNNFAGIALRFQADWTSGGANIVNRYAFQTNTPDGLTEMLALPNGNGTGSGFRFCLYNNLPNTAYGEIMCNAGGVSLISGRTGSATSLPLYLYTGDLARMMIETNGTVRIASDQGSAYGLTMLCSADMATKSRMMGVLADQSLVFLNHGNTQYTHTFTDTGVLTIAGQLNAPSASVTGPAAFGATVSVSGTLTMHSGATVAGNLTAGSLSSTQDVYTTGIFRSTSGTSGGEARLFRVRDGSQVSTYIGETEVGHNVALTYLIASGVRSFAPTVDGNTSSGWSLARWSTVFAVTGAINTSDAREKTAVRPFSPEEMRAAQALAGDIGMYQWLEAIEAKSADGARLHAGVTAQQVEARFVEQGLDASVYGLFCFDEWDDMPEVLGPDDEVIQEARAAGNRYGVRYDELNQFILRGLHENQKNLEARLAALEALMVAP